MDAIRITAAAPTRLGEPRPPPAARHAPTHNEASRSAIATEHLELDERGQVVYRLKTPWRDGTTHMVFDPVGCGNSAQPKSTVISGPTRESCEPYSHATRGPLTIVRSTHERPTPSISAGPLRRLGQSLSVRCHRVPGFWGHVI